MPANVTDRTDLQRSGAIPASREQSLSIIVPVYNEGAGLPRLPRSEVVLHSRVSDARLAGAVRTLAAAFRSAAQ